MPLGQLLLSLLLYFGVVILFPVLCVLRVVSSDFYDVSRTAGKCTVRKMAVVSVSLIRVSAFSPYPHPFLPTGIFIQIATVL